MTLQMDSLGLLLELSELIGKPPASIEILPGGLEEWQDCEVGSGAVQPNVRFPFVYVDGNLGIPKKVLYQLYMAAVKVPRSSPLYAQASTAILIANPAHQTALNARKKLMEAGGLVPQKELTFTELLIRGEGEWAKQSIVWHHRRWIFGVLYGARDSSTSEAGTGGCEETDWIPKIPLSVLRAEFGLIRRACESYPRNYHGWAHWGIVVRGAWEVDGREREEYREEVVSEGLRLREWVNTHVSDYSGMYQLLNLALMVENGGSREEQRLVQLVREQATELAERYPSHESARMYERMCSRILIR